MILAADRCRERSPNFYVADSISEIEDILNPRLGDVALLVAGGEFQVWRLVESEAASDGVTVLDSNACEYRWVFSGSALTPQMFGASTSSDDNAPAFALVIDAAAESGFPIDIPPGTYRHRSNINFNQHSLRVRGLGEVIFQAVGSFSPCISIDAGAAAFEYDISFENISIYGSGAANQTGLYKRNTLHGVVRNVRIKNVTQYGVNIEGDVLTLFENVVLSDENIFFGAQPTIGIRISNSALLSFTTDCTFINCMIEAGTSIGWHLAKCNNSTWIGGTSEGLITAGATALKIDVDSSGNCFKNFFMEANADRDVDCYGNRNSFEDCVASSRLSGQVGITLRAGSYQNTFKGGFVYIVQIEAGALNNSFERMWIDAAITDAAPDSNFTEIIHCRQTNLSATVFPGTRWVDWLRGRPQGGNPGTFWGIKHDAIDMLVENNTGHIRINAPSGSAVQPNRLTVPGVTDLQAGVNFSGTNSPAIFGTDQNDMSIGENFSMLRLVTSAPVNITGILAPTVHGHILAIHNHGGNTITFLREDAASLAANRFAFTTRSIGLGESVLLQYDLISARWRAF